MRISRLPPRPAHQSSWGAGDAGWALGVCSPPAAQVRPRSRRWAGLRPWPALALGSRPPALPVGHRLLQQRGVLLAQEVGRVTP